MITTYINKPDILKWYIYKILLIIRQTTVIFMVSILWVSTSIGAEEFNFEKKGVSPIQITNETKTQTDNNIIWNDEEINFASTINANLSQAIIYNVSNCLNISPFFLATHEKMITIKEEKFSLREKKVGFFTTIDVRGRIVDKNNKPLMGATVKVKGTTLETSTNTRGEFYLQNVDKNAVLVVTYLGFERKEVKAERNIGSVMLHPLSGELKEVKINAGYYTVSDREKTGSISKISSKDIGNQPVANPLAALQGRMAGVQVTQENGVPGGGFRVKIRGQSSLRSNGANIGTYPLYIIDNVPFTSKSLTAGGMATTITGEGSPLANINPSDIESIDILKDADATAIYGSRGSNGVILITTKRGSSSKTTVQVQGYAGFGKIQKRMKLLNTEEYLEMRREAFRNDGTTPGVTSYDLNGKWDQNAYTDWQDVLIGGTARITDFQANVSGGDEQTNFILGASRNREGTVFPGDFSNVRSSARLAITHKQLGTKLHIHGVINYSSGINNLNNYSVAGTIFLPPNTPSIYNDAGGLNWADGTFINPFGSFLKRKYHSDSKILNANSTIDYTIVNGLTVKSSFGYSKMDMNELVTVPLSSINPANNPNSVDRSSQFNDASLKTWIIEPQINFKQKVGKGTFTMLLGSTFQEDLRTGVVLNASGFPNDLLMEDIGSATSISTISANPSQYKYSALFGRINYALNDRYIINLSGRRDGSSRFGKGRRFANFYAGGFAWIFTEENWLKMNLPMLSFGKLKISYGSTGNDQIGDYQYLDTWTSTIFGYSGIGGLSPVRLLNPNFAWETNRKFDMGLELAFLSSKLTMLTNYYKNRSSSQLVGYPLSPSTGFRLVQNNLDALLESSGLEITLGYDLRREKRLSWYVSTNITFPKTRLIDYPGLKSSSYANVYAIGSSLNLSKAIRYLGVNSQTGEYQFEDHNNDSIISSPGDNVNDKSIEQRFYGGLQNSLRFKNWHLDIFLQFVKQTSKDYTALFLLPGTMFNQPKYILNHWRHPNDEETIQRFTQNYGSSAGVAYSNYQRSTGNIVDASYLRLKNVALSYAVSGKFLEKLNFNNFRVFVQGQNLLTLSGYRGFDPETGATQLPPLRVITSGISLTF